MKPEMRARIIAFNKERAADKEKADDLTALTALIAAMPPGQVKNLMKDETCAAILKKYGITGE